MRAAERVGRAGEVLAVDVQPNRRGLGGLALPSQLADWRMRDTLILTKPLRPNLSFFLLRTQLTSIIWLGAPIGRSSRSSCSAGL